MLAQVSMHACMLASYPSAGYEAIGCMHACRVNCGFHAWKPLSFI